MTASTLTFRFTSSLERLEREMPFSILPVPDEIAAAWKKAKVRRLVGTINGHPVNRALMNHADGGSFIIVSRDLIKTARINARSANQLVLRPDPTPDRIELPEEFQLALDQDQEAKARWDTFTPGRQRSLASYVTSAKTEPTRIKRSLELAQKIRTHSLYSDPQAK